MDKKHLKINAGTIDLTDVHQEALEQYETIEMNCGMAIVTPEARKLLAMVGAQINTGTLLDVPQDASVTVLEGEDVGKLYLCDDYTVTVQTFASGDLKKTLRLLTGYEKEELTLMQTLQDGAKRYECVWIAAGESEDQVGRACLLDDGNYVYAVTAMAGESQAGALTQAWQEMFASFRLVSPEAELNTGS